MSILWLILPFLMIIFLIVFLVTDKRVGKMTKFGPVEMFIAAGRPYKSLNAARLFGRTQVFVIINKEVYKKQDVWKRFKKPERDNVSG